ncbi:hypothetical protein SDC9_176666 [bioreactor metagenome]|uniref:Uncharacterized protein n=1 Tax=bioreactor metagenome TaxID=1076179 RepID=A0A645GR86_9ZZZZ
MHPHEREGGDGYPNPLFGDREQIRIAGEGQSKQVRKELADDESHSGDCRCHFQRIVECLLHPAEIAGAVVVPDDGLCTLVKPQYDQQEGHEHRIDDAVCSNRQVAPVTHEGSVQQYRYAGGGNLHTERR